MMGKLTNKDLNALCKMQVKFKKFYVNGIIDIYHKFIQLDVDTFFATFDDYEEYERDSAVYPYGYSAYYNGVEFICITETRHEEAANDGA